MEHRSAIFIEEVFVFVLAVASSHALALASSNALFSSSSGVGPSSSFDFGFTLKSPSTGKTCTLVFFFCCSGQFSASMVGVCRPQTAGQETRLDYWGGCCWPQNIQAGLLLVRFSNPWNSS